MFSKLLGNSKGFSLTSVIVASGMMGLLAVGMIKINKMMGRTAVFAEGTYEVQSVLNEIRRLLSRSENCLDTLGGLDADSAAGITEVVQNLDGGDKNRFAVNQKMGRVTVLSYELSSADASVGIDGGEDEGTTHLEITFNRGKGGYREQITKKMMINVQVTSAGDHTITNCSAAGGNSNIWLFAATGSGIYYNGGFVGVGEDDPEALIHLKSDTPEMRIEDATNAGTKTTYYLSVDDDGANARANLGLTDGTTDLDILTIVENGRVGIGSVAPSVELDVLGDATLDGEGGADTNLYFKDPSTKGIIKSNKGMEFLVGTGGNPTKSAIYIAETTGRVGVGTTSPQSSFDVAHAGSNTSALRVGDPSDASNSTSVHLATSGNAYIGSSSTGGDVRIMASAFGGGQSGLTVTSAGDVGVGTAAPGSTLHVGGELQIDSLAAAAATTLCINAGVVSSCSSSIRYKSEISNLKLGLREVLKMRPVEFVWHDRGERDIGLIAEEMNKIDPILNTFQKDGETIEGVKYRQLTVVLINAVQELNQRFLKERKRNNRLEKRLKRIEKIMARLEQ
jgi:hypothetical protein